MPRKKKIDLDSKIQEKLDFIGLDLENIPKNLKEYVEINFRTIKGYDEKRYKQYRFINVKDIEILLSPTNRVDSIKEKYENASPVCYYLDSSNEDTLPNYTKFLDMLNKVRISQIREIENEQNKLSKEIPFRVKYSGNYLWQIYYSEVSNKYFMLVPTEDSDYSTFFYLLKKKIENKKNDKIFVPVSLVDYEEKILTKEEIKDIENYLWVFTKDYPLIYEVWNKKEEVSLNIIGETEVFENIKTSYKICLKSTKEAAKYYKLIKALFILQTVLPHYYKFETNINNEANLEFNFENHNIKYEILPEFIMEQYLRSISLKNKANSDIDEFEIKLKKLQEESKNLEEEYVSKEKQITTFLECKKTFFGKVKYFFKFGKKTIDDKKNKVKIEENLIDEEKKTVKQNFKLEEKNYTLFELEQSFKELETKEEIIKKLVMDINALKLKNKNLKKKIENAGNYIDEINKHKKSIFDFWKYSNKDAVATLDEGEEEEINIKRIEKVFNFEDDFEKFGISADKVQRTKYTDSELESAYIATTDIIDLINKIDLNTAANKEISEKLKEIKLSKLNSDINYDDEEESFNIFGRVNQSRNKERTLGNKTHRENPRDKYLILEIKKGCKGIELKRHLETVIKDLRSALSKNTIEENMYVYKASIDKIDFDSFGVFNLNVEEEIEKIMENDRIRSKIYLYKIKVPKGTNFMAFSNIVFYDNKNMTLPVGMNLSTKILLDMKELNLKQESLKTFNKMQFEDKLNDFSKIIIKDVEVIEYK